MSFSPELGPPGRTLRHELDVLRGHWFWFLALGLALLVLGTLAVGAPLLTSLAVALTTGVLLFVGGAVEVVGAFWARDWSGVFLHLLGGVLYLVLGLLFIRAPVASLEALTLLLAAGLLVDGLFRIVGALTYRFASWGWVLVGGLLDLVLGLLIWQQYPFSGLWVIGLFVGIQMIYSGVLWITLALGLRRRPRLGD